MASDSAATFAASGLKTIGQQEIPKIHKLSDSILYSGTGAVGIAQLIANEIKVGWDKKEFQVNAPEEVMNRIGKKIAQLVSPYLQTANLTRPLVGDASASLCKSLVAMPVKNVPCLFSFDYNGAPEKSTPELPFVAMGIGQPIADPFLAFLKRLLWEKTVPTLGEGRLAAVWTINHVGLTNPGGVGGPIQLATLSAKEGKVTILSDNDVQEHLQQIGSAERALTDQLRAPGRKGEPTPLAEIPKVCGT
jgi:20S proteasome alpha/beta subunit